MGACVCVCVCVGDVLHGLLDTMPCVYVSVGARARAKSIR